MYPYRGAPSGVYRGQTGDVPEVQRREVHDTRSRSMAILRRCSAINTQALFSWAVRLVRQPFLLVFFLPGRYTVTLYPSHKGVKSGGKSNTCRTMYFTRPYFVSFFPIPIHNLRLLSPAPSLAVTQIQSHIFSAPPSPPIMCVPCIFAVTRVQHYLPSPDSSRFALLQ